MLEAVKDSTSFYQFECTVSDSIVSNLPGVSSALPGGLPIGGALRDRNEGQKRQGYSALGVSSKSTELSALTPAGPAKKGTNSGLFRGFQSEALQFLRRRCIRHQTGPGSPSSIEAGRMLTQGRF
jgi:hypothetical protein